MVGSSFVSSIRIHEPHPDECWGFLLPPFCFVFILTLTYSSSSSIVVGYCLDRFLFFFLAVGDIFFLFGDVTGIMFNRLKLTLFAFFISRRIGTDQTGGVCREDQRIVRRDDR